MAEETIVTNIVARSNFSDLIGDLGKVSSRLSVLQAQLTNTNRALANQAAQMQKSFASTLRSTGQFSTHFVSLASDVDKFGKSLDSGQLKLGQYYGAWKEHSKTAGGLIRDLAKQQVQMQNAILQPLGKNAQGLMQFNVHVPQGLDEIANKTKIASQEMKIMNKVIQDGANQVINWGKNTQWAGRQLTMGLTLPIVAFGASAQKAFLEADQQLVRLTKVYGGVAQTSAAELKKVRAEVSATARDLASAYGASYKDTISLAADIAATGKTGNELLKSTAETTRLSILGEVDRQEAMKATLAIQTAFKQNTTQLGESINFLNAVENQTSTSLQDLVEAIPKAGPVIQAMGGSIKDLALYMTAMKEGGISASEGANALKSAMASLVNPTKVAKDMFAGFGIDLGGIVTKNAGNLTGTILELQSALDTLDPLKKQQAIEQLFGKFQFARMNALFANLGKQGSQTLAVMDLMKASSKDLANIASREMTTMTESASGKYKRALETLKADMAGVGDQFLSVSTRLLNVVDGIIKFFNHLPKPLKSIMTFVAGLTAVAGPLIMLTGLLANFFGYIAKGIFHFKAFLKGGEGFKLLTPEILAAEKAGNLMETTFYNDAKAAAVLKKAIANLTAELSLLETKANSATVAVGPAIKTSAGAPLQGLSGSDVIVDKNHPLVGQPYTRQMAHFIPAGSEQPGTIFGVVPNPGPVNQRLGKNLQMYANADMPQVSGLSSIRGINTGVIPAEAAKWHSMVGALAMQSETELKVLRTEVNATQTVTTELAASYEALLPQMTNLTKLAADESAVIVGELQAGKITVDAAKSKIAALNAEIETMMGQAATQVATAQGRAINLTQVPLTNQPAVTATGKSNMKELFHKGPTASFVDSIANVLGVRTSGAGYSRETTIPRVTVAPFLKRNSGGHVYDPRKHGAVVPGDTSINYDNTPAMLPLNGFVLNQKQSLNPRNQDLVAMADGSPGSGSSNVPAIVTPGETVYTPEVLAKNPGLRETLVRVNNGYAYGGTIISSKPNYGPYGPGTSALAAELKILTALSSGARKPSGVSANASPRAGASPKATEYVQTASRKNYNSYRLQNPEIAQGLPQQGDTSRVVGHVFTNRFLRTAGVNPNSGSAPRLLPNEIQNIFGFTPKSKSGYDGLYDVLPNFLVTIPKSFNIKLVDRIVKGNFVKASAKPQDWLNGGVEPKHFITVIDMLMKRGASYNQALEVADKVLLNINSKMMRIPPDSVVNELMFGNMMYGSTAQELKVFEQSKLGKFIASAASPYAVGGNITNKKSGYGYTPPKWAVAGNTGRNMFKGEYKSPLHLTQQYQDYLAKEQADYQSKLPRDNNGQVWYTPEQLRLQREGKGRPFTNPQPKKYYQDLSNDNPLHGALQIGRFQPAMHVRNQYVGPQLRYNAPVGQNWRMEGFSKPAPVLGTLEDRAKASLFRYMQGDYQAIANKEVQDYLSTIRTKFTGTLHRGVNWQSTDSLPPFVKQLIRDKKWEELVGQEFIMRRASWSKNPQTAKGFGLGIEGKGYSQIIMTADVKNRNAVPASEIFPDLTFQTPKGPVAVNESEVYMGGKFRIVAAGAGKIKLQAVYDQQVDGKRENGGPVNAGRPYLVGEKGPELFVPKNAGGIISHYQLGGMIRASKSGYGLPDPGVDVNSFTEESARKAVNALKTGGNPAKAARAQLWLMTYGKKAIPANGGIPVSKYDPSFVPGKTRGSGTNGAGFTDWQMRGSQVGSFPSIYQPPTARTLYGETKGALGDQLLKTQKMLVKSITALTDIQKATAASYKQSGISIVEASKSLVKMPSQIKTDLMSPFGLVSRSQVAPNSWKELLTTSKGFGRTYAPILDRYGRPMAGTRQGFEGAYGIENPFMKHPMLTSIAATAATGYAGQKVAEKNPMLGNLISTVGGSLAFMLPQMMMGRASIGKLAVQKAVQEGTTVAEARATLQKEKQIAKIISKTGATAKEAEASILTGEKIAATGAKAGRFAKYGGMAFKAANVGKSAAGVAVASQVELWPVELILAAGQAAWIYKRHVEDIGKANRAAFGPTKASLKEVGIEYKSLTERVQSANKAHSDFISRMMSSTRNSKGKLVGGLTLTQAQVDAEVKRIQGTKSETVQDFNKTYGSANVIKLATSLKQQYISAGMSASEATNKVYAFMKASNKASYAFSAITNAGFKSITDQSTAADYAINNVIKSLKTAKGEELATGVQNIVNSLDAYKNGLVGTKDVNGKIIDQYAAQQAALDKIINLKGSANTLDQDTVDAIKKQDLYLGGVITKADTLQSIYAKSALLQNGYGSQMDIGGLSATDSVKAAKGMEIWQNAVDQTVKAIPGLGTAYEKLGSQVKAAAKAQVDPSIQKALETKIKLQDELIQKIKDEADARLKALDAEQSSADFSTSLKKEQLAYQNALAAGDMSGAAQAQLNIKALIQNKSIADAKQAITDKANADIKAAEKTKTGYQNTIDANANAVANQQLAAQKQANDYSALGTYITSVDSLLSHLTPGTFDPTSTDKTTPSYQAMVGIKQALQDLADSGPFGKKKAGEFQKLIDAATYTKDGKSRTGESAWVSNMLTASDKAASTLDTSQFDTSIKAFRDAVEIFAKTQGYSLFRAPDAGEFNPGNWHRRSSSYLQFVDPNDSSSKIQIKADSANYEKVFNYAHDRGWTWTGYSAHGSGIPKTHTFNYNPNSEDVGTSSLPTLKQKATGGAVNGYARGGSYAPGAGGYIRGNGTPTSDSILLQTGSGGFIRASDKEYMHPASAVSYYGTHFMDLIRSRSISKRMVDTLIGKPKHDIEVIPEDYIYNKHNSFKRNFKGDGSAGPYIPGTMVNSNDYATSLYKNAAMGGAIPGYLWGGSILGMLKAGLNRSPRSAAAMASYSAGKEAEKYLSLRFGASENASGIEKWGKAFARFGFDALNGGISGAVAGGGGGFVGGSVAGTFEGLVGLIKSGSQFGVKGGTAYKPDIVKKRKDITWGSQNPFINSDGGVYVDDLAKSDLSHMSLGKSLKNVLINGLIGAALPIPGDMLSQAAATKAAVRQGVQVFDKRLPKFINNMMELGWLNPTQVLKDRNKILTNYQGIAAPADKILPGKGSVNIYGPRAYAYKAAHDPGGHNGSIVDGVKAFINPFKKSINYSAYVSPIDNNVVMPGLSKFMSKENLLNMPSSTWKDIITKNKSSIRNKQEWWHSGTPNTLFHELGHRQLNILGGPSILPGAKYNTMTGEFLWSPLHEGYADVFHEKAAHIFKDAGIINGVKPALELGNTYITSPGNSLLEDLLSHTSGAINNDRRHQYGAEWLKAYANVVDPFIPSSTYRRLASMARVERYRSPDDVLAVLRNKSHAIGGSLSGLNIPKFHDGGQVHTKFANGETMALLKDKEHVFTPEQMDALSGRFNTSSGDKTYTIAPVIHAAPGMDEHALVQMAVRQSVDAFKSLQYNETRTKGMGRSR